MNQHIIVDTITQAMLPHLDNAQMRQLSFVLERVLSAYDISPKNPDGEIILGPSNPELLSSFLSAKRLEGCSDNTLRYYKAVVSAKLK